MTTTSYIKHGDCYNLMQSLYDDSIDMVVTSPPYDNMRTYNGAISQWSFDKFKLIAQELVRTLKRGGVIIWVVADQTIKGSETGTSFRQALYFMELGLNLHDTMIWIKDGGGSVGSNLCYRQNFEYMFVFSKGRPKAIHLIQDHINKTAGHSRKGKGRRKADGSANDEKGRVRICPETSRRNNWWLIPRNSVDLGHPAVFPYAIARDHIISWSNENDIVLDPFMGSGTTCLAAKDLNRRYIGFEIDEEYFEIAKTRLE